MPLRYPFDQPQQLLKTSSWPVRTRVAHNASCGPLPLDRPSPEALMILIVSSKVAVLDESPGGVAACKVDDLELAHVDNQTETVLVVVAYRRPALGAVRTSYEFNEI